MADAGLGTASHVRTAMADAGLRTTGHVHPGHPFPDHDGTGAAALRAAGDRFAGHADTRRCPAVNTHANGGASVCTANSTAARATDHRTTDHVHP